MFWALKPAQATPLKRSTTATAIATAVGGRQRFGPLEGRLPGVTGSRTDQDWFHVMVMLAARPWSALVAEESSMAVNV